MADKSITAANSVFTLSVAGLFPAAVNLNGYSSDRAFMTDSVDVAEAIMGVDGKLSAGWTPNPVKQTVSLQADSNARDIFSAIDQASATAREVYFLNGSIALPGLGESYSMTRGVITSVKKIPDAAKVLQPVEVVITWERVDRVPL